MSLALPPLPESPDLSFSALRAAYAAGETVSARMQDLLDHIDTRVDPLAWIYRLPREDVMARARALDAADATQLPLFGIPFAVKDNIDVAGIPTTAACPEFSYIPKVSATVVQRLLDAGAILIGKTNLDQFATGLVGVRSPYGVPSSVFSREHVSGGSSSGSAVAVAAGAVSFSLGTDTAGSGRVPAAFNNIVGYKPTRGMLSGAGMVPACRSLDTVSVFALNCSDGWEVMSLAAGRDAADPLSRTALPVGLPKRLRIGVPRMDQREFFGDTTAEVAYAAALDRLAKMGELVEFDFAPFSETAALLYEGPWVAERLEATQQLLRDNPNAIEPAVRSIVEKGLRYSAVDAHRGYTHLATLRAKVAPTWAACDVIALPTAPTHYRIDAVRADPVRLNSHLGTYTNFANLLDLCALAVPSSMRPDGLPFGITFFAPAWHDAALAKLGDRYHRESALPCGGTPHALPSASSRFEWPAQPGSIRLAVVGAHLDGMPLNHELTERAGRLVRDCESAPQYRLYALPGTVPPKPGMQRVAEGGVALKLQVWELSAAAFGDFVSRIPAPLGIGSVVLDDGEVVKGFLCEAIALQGAQDISEFGGWRAYVASLTCT
ncbi:allophanate hydrolase [Viridibacterium curvum]|uniref:Allophanate hydrolase n=1 Tax=Viridibacterium curvum TaxID=1101404 RepID=A0ABP9QWI0_9RHOO